MALRVGKDIPAEERLQAQEDLLARAISVTGPDSGPASNARTMIAGELEGMGRFDEARLLRREVLAAHQRNVGVEHVATLSAELWLAINLRNSGLPTQARPLAEHAFEGRRRLLGADHKTTLSAQRFLATVDDTYEG